MLIDYIVLAISWTLPNRSLKEDFSYVEPWFLSDYLWLLGYHYNPIGFKLIWIMYILFRYNIHKNVHKYDNVPQTNISLMHFQSSFCSLFLFLCTLSVFPSLFFFHTGLLSFPCPNIYRLIGYDYSWEKYENFKMII